MCHYVSTVRKFEILSIKCDFYMDSNYKIWFFYAKDILYRPRKLSLDEINMINK